MDLSLKDRCIKMERMILGLFKTIVIVGLVLVPLMALGIEIEPPINVLTIPELVNVITTWAFYLGMILAPLMILVGALYFMTAGGNPERVKTGQKIIFWTIVGLGIILFSKVIINIIEGILKGTL